jgi:hypothetical protein
MFEKSLKECSVSRQPSYNRSVLWCIIVVGEVRCAVVGVHLDIDVDIFVYCNWVDTRWQ